MKKNKNAIILLIVLFILALLVTIYPMVSNAMYEANSSKVQTEYFETIENLDSSAISAARKAAEDYNSLLSQGIRLDEVENILKYDELLNMGANGIMCYVEIPAISVDLPVAHGTEASTLENSIGHVIGSSLPVGGESTHAVLSGHSGMSGKMMFTDLHALKTEDMVYIRVLDDTLSYRVDTLETVLPEDTSSLYIQQGADKLSLITCTPVGVNSHRLIVHCSRAEDTPIQAAEVSAAASTWRQEYFEGIGYGLAALLCALIFYEAVCIWRLRYGKRN